MLAHSLYTLGNIYFLANIIFINWKSQTVEYLRLSYLLHNITTIIIIIVIIIIVVITTCYVPPISIHSTMTVALIYQTFNSFISKQHALHVTIQ